MDNLSLSGGTLPTPPVLNVADGIATISSESSGTIYYTLDGNDPRASGGAISGTAYTSVITLGSATSLKARVRGSDGSWSALVTRTITP